jgi:ribosomal-protein-alanine N-acetyltransferase
MHVDDVAEVAALEALSFADPWSPDAFAEELEAPQRAYFVAETSGNVVGYAGIMLVDDDAHLMNLAVDAESRADWPPPGGRWQARAMGATRMTLEVAEQRRRNRAHESGVVAVGEQRHTRRHRRAALIGGDLPEVPPLGRPASRRPESSRDETSCDETSGDAAASCS